MNRISSSLTPFFKYVIPVCIVTLSIGSLIDAKESHANLIFFFVINLVGWTVWYLYAAKARTVYQDGVALVLKNKNESERIPFSEIKSIDQDVAFSTKTIEVILLDGRTVSFIPDDLMSVLSESPIVEQIRTYKKHTQSIEGGQ